MLKILVYLIEYFAMRAWARIRGLPVDPLPQYTPEQKARLREVARELWADWRRVRREFPGAAPWPRVGRHLKRYRAILGDLPAFLRRKRAGLTEDLAGVAIDPKIPAYFRRNYHFQTDGYFSEASALRYDHQIELLFLGMGHVLRKVAFARAKPYLRPGARVLEFGAGNGVSGDQFKALFPEARLTLLDPSEAYLDYARKTYPGRFEESIAEPVERLAAEAEYDLAFSCFVMHEIPVRHWDEALARLRRALRPGGTLLIVDAQQDKDEPRNRFALDFFQNDFFEPYFPEHRAADLEASLARAGFQVASSRPVMFSKAIVALRA